MAGKDFLAGIAKLAAAVLVVCFVLRSASIVNEYNGVPETNPAFFQLIIGLNLLNYVVWILLDRILNLCVFCIVSAVTVLLASGSVYLFLFGGTGKQLLIVVCFFAAFAAGFLVFRKHWNMTDRFFNLLASVTVFFLFLNLIAAKTRNGARLWIDLPAALSLQPGELIKAFLMIMGAGAYNNRKRIRIYALLSVFSAGAFVLLKDLGGAAIIMALFLLMTWFLLENNIITSVLVTVFVLVAVIAIQNSGYAMVRLSNWTRVLSSGSGQQADMIKAATFGGLKGLGIENSRQVLRIYAAHNDMALVGAGTVFGAGFFVCDHSGIHSADYSDGK